MTLLLPLLLIQAPGVSIELPATPLPQALQRLSEATGKKLSCAPVFANEIVFARLDAAPADAAIANLAKVLLAKWKTESDGTLRLVRNPDAEEAEQRLVRQRNAAMLSSSIAYLRKRLARQPEELDAKAIEAYRRRLANEENARRTAEAAKDYDRMFLASDAAEEAPGWRAIARLVPLLDRSFLLDLPNDAREVWAERPTPMQHALPSSAGPVLTRYRRELALLQPGVEVARVKLILKKWENDAAFNVSLEALDAAGSKIDSAAARMNADSDLMKIPLRQRNPFLPPGNESPIGLSQEVQEARTLLSKMSNEADRVALLPKWKPRIADPVRVEPTQWHRSADLIAAAKGLGRNLVGVASDFIGAAYAKPRRWTASTVIQKCGQDIDSTDPGWLLYRSREPAYRASRSLGRQLLQRSLAAGGITVDDAAAWAARTEIRWPFGNWIGDYMGVLFPDRGPYSALSTMLEDTSLRLWDSLGPAARQELRDGATLDLARLPSSLRRRLTEMVYWFEALDGDGDPTERLPNGIRGGAVSLRTIEKPVFIGWSSKAGRTVAAQPLDGKMLGTFLANGNTWSEIPRETYLAYDRYLLGINRTYELHFLFAPGSVPMTVSLSETLFDPSGEPVQRLPEKLRDEVERERQAALQKGPKSATTGTIPPRL